MQSWDLGLWNPNPVHYPLFRGPPGCSPWTPLQDARGVVVQAAGSSPAIGGPLSPTLTFASTLNSGLTGDTVHKAQSLLDSQRGRSSTSREGCECDDVQGRSVTSKQLHAQTAL